jgi:hypothetical protein
MFTYQDVLARVRKRPFVPIRFVTSSGEKYDAYHPEMVWVGRREIQVGTPTKDDPAVYERVAFLSLLHITAIEPIPPKGKRSNGAKR